MYAAKSPMLQHRAGRLVECPYCGDTTWQSFPIESYVCGACDQPFSVGHPLLRQCGEALYGARWQTALADALHVNDRTVRAWLTGRQQPRPAVWDAVWDLLYARWGEIEAAMVALNEREAKGGL
jgi:DNA-directed RNA polymerase subunit RPC12/RpoP